MEALVPEIISNILGYSPTLDLGRMMRVSRQFNQVLTDSVFLWRDVEIEDEEPISKKNALETIQAFASRSQHTLQTVWYPTSLNLEEFGKIFSILEKSKSTLRQICIHPEVPREDLNAITSFLISFPNIEELRLSEEKINVPVQLESVPGKLSVLVLDQLPSIRCWSQDILNKLSSLKVLVIMAIIDTTVSGGVQEHCLRLILEKCKSSLNTLQLQGKWTGKQLNCEFPNLVNVCFHSGSNFSQLFSSQPPRLQLLIGTPIVLGGLGFKNLKEVSFWVVGQDEGEGESSLTSLEQMVKICSDSGSTLQQIAMASVMDSEVHSIDFFLRALMPSTSTLCPLLSSFYLNDAQVYSFELLAEVMIARNLAARSRKDSGFERCSDLTLYLDQHLIGRFRDAEREVLSRHSDLNAKKAGLAQVVEWI